MSEANNAAATDLCPAALPQVIDQAYLASRLRRRNISTDHKSASSHVHPPGPVATVERLVA